jgi:glycosyltransferase involved in cell wall biosynthesis
LAPNPDWYTINDKRTDNANSCSATDDRSLMRIAWFSPLPPQRSGIAAYNAELLAELSGRFHIDTYPEATAHDFVWRARRTPYDLVVYHMGNAPCHDYLWGYLVRYPGLVVLHDARLHHARARCLLDRDRITEYRDEFQYDHPATDPAVTQYAIEGLGGAIYYLWPMVRVIMETARTVAVHSPWLAGDLRETFPQAHVEAIRMGVPLLDAAPDARTVIRRQLGFPHDAIVFAAFGKVSAEKRVPTILTALETLVREDRRVFAMFVGDADGYPSLGAEIAAHGLSDHVRVTDHVPDAAVGAYLAAADACLCLRWPTALESSASWLRCLAARRPTVISDLAHLIDIPADIVARVPPSDERRTLLDTMRRLARDAAWRDALAGKGHAYWRSSHTIEAMADDYARLLPTAAARAVRLPPDLPGHFLSDYSQSARELARHIGVNVDVLA